MGSVRFQNITKEFGDKAKITAVDNSNLEIRDGEFTVLVGPSGCGKSTSLRMIAGLERPTSGEIFIGDREVTRLHPRARNIAMVFQDYALYPHMTVKENLSFGLRNLGFKRREWEPRVIDAAKVLGIEPLLGRRPRELSGGQRQRVALGRAIVREPEVFLLDEPLSNLDAKLRVQMRVELAELQRRLGTTMVYVTHDQEEAMTLGHRIVVMRDGLIQQMDTPETIYNLPTNAFVARFIGSPPMNLFAGALHERQGKVVFSGVDGDFDITLPPAWQRPLRAYVGREIFLGIRPENISSAAGSTGGKDSRRDAHSGARGDSLSADDPSNLLVKVKATAVEMLGPQKLAYFKVGKELAVASLAPDHPARATDEIETVWNGHKLHVFDGETEERLDLQPETVSVH
ncbi:MAG: sn-glycerol-3-phosphate ABC transporter ATP-binding protein UgpC [Trueperaceae bacterium]